MHIFQKKKCLPLLLLTIFCLISCQPAKDEIGIQFRNKKSDEFLNIGLLPDAPGDGDSVSIYPMEAMLDKLQALGADIVIPVGDLTNHGTTHEFEQWTRVAQKYREAGIEFLSLMDNHETSHAYTVIWVEYMKNYIPEDAVLYITEDWEMV